MSSNQGGAGRREVAWRVFAAEYDDATLEHSDSDEERAPNYVVTPTGARINRLFVVGVLTEVEQVSDEVLRGRVVDPTGGFVVYAGQYQPDAMAFLERADPPAFVAVTGKARTFQPDDSDVVYTSIRPESINAVDAETRDRWTVQTAEQTLARVGTFAKALESGERGDALRQALAAGGADDGLAAGVPLAMNHYGTTDAYLAGVRDVALDAARVVADERDEVGALSVAPDDAGDGVVSLAAAREFADVDVESEAVAVDEPTTGDEFGTSDDAGEDGVTGDSGSADATVGDGASAATDSASSDADADSDTTHADSDTTHASASEAATDDATTTEADATEAAATPETGSGLDAETATDPAGDSATVDEDAAGDEVAAAPESDGVASDADDGETTFGEDDLGDFDADETGDDLGDFDAGGDANDDLGDFDADADDDGLGDFDADDASADDASGEGASFDTDEMYEFDDEERERIEEEYGTEFSTGTEVDSPGEAGIETPGPEDADADADAASEAASADGADVATDDESVADDEPADVDSLAEDAVDEDAASGDAGGDGGADPGDLEDTVMETMTSLNGDDGVERETLLAAVVSEYDVTPGEVEDALQDALMAGRCYESGEDTLKPI
ncbi:hypothetical protein [Halomicrococcus gelatinilyticus]|uniref:hypothetical protein n=1 Tax=Halomicrococcus gelatinilyticus TaxID=1702103 RepID=UPI002E0E04BE